MVTAPRDTTVDLEPWRLAAQALNLHPSYAEGRLAWRGRPSGLDLLVEVDPAGPERADVSVVVTSASLSDRLVVAPLALALVRDGRFLTGDLDLDRAVVIHGDRPDVAAPWDAGTRASARRLVGELGLVIAGSAARLGPHGTARATDTGHVPEILRGLVDLVAGLTTRDDVAEDIEAIATGDPSPAVRGMYAQLLAEAAPTGALGEARARELIDNTGGRDQADFDLLMRAARESPSSQIREDALVKLLASFPVARVEPLLLTTEDSLGARVRDALLAAIGREGPPVSVVSLLRLMARTPFGPTSLKAAAAALGVAEDPAGAARLAGLCQHKEEQVWLTALGSLLRLRLAPAQLLHWLDGADRPEVFDRLPELAAALGTPNAAPVLLLVLARADTATPPARLAAIARALGQLAHAPAREALAVVADHPDPLVAAAARDALAALPAL